MRIRRILLTIAAVVLIIAVAVGLLAWRALGTFPVAVPAELQGDEPGSLVAVERFGKYPAFAARWVVDTIELPEPVEISQGITLYRVQYRTTNHDGQLVDASGLLAIPDEISLNSVVNYYHGTNATRSSAPSQPGLGEGVFVAAATAGGGHILLAPDYIGLGESRALHPYMHAETTATTCIDFLDACHAFVNHLGGDWPPDLYLFGFSQGGHATLAVQRELEKLNDSRFQVKAAAPIAGPFHLRDLSFPQALTGETDSHVFYLSYLSNAYSNIYGQPIESILTSPYVDSVPVLFDGDHSFDEIAVGMPGAPRELFTSEFLDAYENGQQHWFLNAIEENDIYDWTPQAPIRAYYGENDVDVLPEEARRAETSMKERGVNFTAISVGPYDHEESALHAIPKALNWFRELAAQSTNAAP